MKEMWAIKSMYTVGNKKYIHKDILLIIEQENKYM